MKNLPILSFALLLGCPLLVSNPYQEPKKKLEFHIQEYSTVLNEEMNLLIKNITPKNKVIILDANFNKIREETVDNIENLNNHSMLVPIIYRSPFVTQIYNVSYCILQKNNDF